MYDVTQVAFIVIISTNLIILETVFRKNNNLTFKKHNILTSFYINITNYVVKEIAKASNLILNNKDLYGYTDLQSVNNVLESDLDEAEDDSDNIEVYEDIVIDDEYKSNWFNFWSSNKSQPKIHRD